VSWLHAELLKGLAAEFSEGANSPDTQVRYSDEAIEGFDYKRRKWAIITIE
jgi:hypothetical protein